MIRVSEVYETAPTEFKTELQRLVYGKFAELGIPFTRVDNDPAVTMEACEAIDAALQVKVCKTLFLCNRQQTMFYLYVMPGDKPFVTKEFGAALGISRVSFAPEQFLLPKLGTVIGATTVFSAWQESAKDVRVVIDNEVLKDEWYGGTDGTTTCYLRIAMKDFTEKILPDLGIEFTRIN